MSLENIENSVKSEPIQNMQNMITPPPTPIRRELEHSHHSEDDTHSSINHLINRNNNEHLGRILDIKLESDSSDMEDLNAFCYNIIQKKFKEAVRVNIALPSESDKKKFKLKVYKNTDCNSIKESIVNTINNPDPKIHMFINSTINIVMLSEMKEMERMFVSVFNNTFHKIVFKSKLKSKLWGSNYYEIEIDLLSINFV